MKILSPGKFLVKIGEEHREIIVSLGLKTELYKLITRAQLSMANMANKIAMDPDIASRIQTADAEVKRLEAAEAPEQEIQTAKLTLDLLYEEALKDVEAKQRDALERVVVQRIDLTEQTFAEALSCLLSKRDDYGKITEKLDPEVIMWSPVYGEAQEELAEFLYAVVDYITSALKKISAISQMVEDATKPKEKNPASQS